MEDALGREPTTAELADELSWHPNEVARVDPVTGDVIGLFAVTGSSIGMDDVAQALPWATQGLVRTRTGDYVGGREIRGRTFVPGPTEVSSDAGVPIGAYTSSVQTAFENFGTAAGPAGGVGVYSPTNGSFHFGELYSVWDQWAVLRSRRD